MCLAGGPSWEVGPKFDATFERVALRYRACGRFAPLVDTLADAGFAVSSARCWEGTPFSNVPLIGRRAG